MNQRLLITLLLAAPLLFGTLGCSKKDDPVGPAVSTGSYKLDGKTITCQAKVFTGSSYSGAVSVDFLDVYLRTTPEPASGEQLLQLTYNRSSPTSPYQLDTIYLFDKGSLSLTCSFNSTAATATLTSNGSYTGTFAAREDGHTGPPPPYTLITAGSFVNARL